MNWSWSVVFTYFGISLNTIRSASHQMKICKHKQVNAVPYSRGLQGFGRHSKCADLGLTFTFVVASLKVFRGLLSPGCKDDSIKIRFHCYENTIFVSWYQSHIPSHQWRSHYEATEAVVSGRQTADGQLTTRNCLCRFLYRVQGENYLQKWRTF